jgi:hypothetical protein
MVRIPNYGLLNNAKRSGWADTKKRGFMASPFYDKTAAMDLFRRREQFCQPTVQRRLITLKEK